jgi:hypothetical protein
MDEFLRRRWLVRTRVIWVITLTPTKSKAASLADPPDSKIDPLYISEQLGYLALPIGAITSKRIREPAMVLAVVTKFDLFADRDGVDPVSSDARRFLEHTFEKHLARLKAACERRSVPFQVEYCSALEGWRVESLMRHVKRALFSKK